MHFNLYSHFLIKGKPGEDGKPGQNGKNVSRSHNPSHNPSQYSAVWTLFWVMEGHICFLTCLETFLGLNGPVTPSALHGPKIWVITWISGFMLSIVKPETKRLLKARGPPPPSSPRCRLEGIQYRKSGNVSPGYVDLLNHHKSIKLSHSIGIQKM